MNDIKKILDLYLKAGLGPRMIARALNKPKSTISDYINRFNRSDLKREDLDTTSAEDIYRSLFPTENPRPKQRLQKIMPDLGQMHLELKKKYVTRQLLRQEYRDMYPDAHYGYTRFCNLYRDFQKRLNVSMRISHKAGEKIFIDFSGLKWHVIDRNSGEEKEVEIFVASLGASGYTFAEAAMDQTKPSLIACAVHAFEFFGGVPEILVPDNLKSAVTRADRYDPEINSSFQDMADHYDCVVIPARPYRAKDKAKVELSVKLVQRWILARLRHRQFFSPAELNRCIFSMLDEFNGRIIRRYGRSRHALYLELDKPALKPLPERRYVYREFKECTVNIDYHVEIEGCFYSVPSQLAGVRVSCIYSSGSVEIFHDNSRVALHVRLYKKGAFATQEEHMASSHRVYGTWTPSRLIEWGSSFGVQTSLLMKTILQSRPHPEMGFRSCMAILNIAKHHGDIHAVEETSR